MKVHAKFARRFRLLRILVFSLVLGAVYDVAFAGLMLFAPELPGRLLGLPLPGEPFYLWLMAVLLCMLAALYVLAARDPRRYSAIILIAIVGRFGGAVVLAFAAFGRPELSGLYPLALADLAFGAFHAAAWVPLKI